MFLLLGFFLPQEVEQIVRVGRQPGYTYESCIQLPEGFFDLPELLFAGIIRLDTVFVEQLPVGVGAVDLFRETCKPSQGMQLGIEFLDVGLPQRNFRIAFQIARQAV